MISKMNDNTNREEILDELSNFDHRKSGEIPAKLEKYLEGIAQNGDTLFPWNKLQPLLRRKLELVMDEFNQLCPTDHLIPLPNVKPFNFEELKQQILESIDSFGSAPFTVQRLCELITNPSKHYKRTDKFMRGIEKNILVVSTINPKASDGSTTQCTPSIFKSLFHPSNYSSHVSPTNSSPSSSHLINGMADVLCDQQMALHCGNDPSLHPLSGQMSSSPNSHLPPLQQLDSFTTVFATNPSTPLSVVSDLHSYEHSSSLSLMTHTSSDLLESNSSDQKPDISTNQEVSSVVSSSDSSNTSTSTNSLIKDDSSSNSSSDSTHIDSNQPNSFSEVTESSKTISNEQRNESIDADIIKRHHGEDNDSKCDQIDSSSSVTSSENSIPTENHMKTDEKISCDPLMATPEESKPTETESVNGSSNCKAIDSIDVQNDNEIRVSNDEEMCPSMDFCKNSASNDNNTDMTDCSDKNSDSNPMDETSNQSDQSEPMDED